MRVSGYIEVTILVPGELIIDDESYRDWLDGREATDETLLAYCLSDPDWQEGSSFPRADQNVHEIADVVLVAAEPLSTGGES